MPSAWARVDLAAYRHNLELLQRLVDPALLCAVVKADAYGHGLEAMAAEAATTGVPWMAVAQTAEATRVAAQELGTRVLLLSEPPIDEWDEAVAAGVTATVYTPDGVAAADAAARRAGVRLAVHLKVDTGMHRVGADPGTAADLAGQIRDRDSLELEGLWTHCPVADEPDRDFTDRQLDELDEVIAVLGRLGHQPELVHAGNSAVALAHPRGRLDLVRVGIASYGIPPAPALAHAADLRPVMSVFSRVSMVRRVAAGEAVSYGLENPLDRETTVATVPVGYADGIARTANRAGAEVLIRGARRRITGAVTMDQLMVDCGDDEVGMGDEVVLVGRQGAEEITATEWAERLGTIAYEIVCGIGPRVERRYVNPSRQDA